jgi:transglutaminase-like putative cysteine protease
MGIEMLPVSKAIALAPPGKYAPSVDLAYATSLKTDKPLEDPSTLSGLTVRVTAKNLKSVPSGDFQTAKRDGEFWLIDVHPPKLDAVTSAAIAEAASEKPEWTKPSLYIPSDSKKFKDLAQTIIGDKKDVQSASLAIHRWVNTQMKANAGIGVLRDATEVLKTKEGVCRDYAILTVTLLRSAGIPARLASGIVNWDGAFYYHAWAEAWDGSRWLGIDSTTDREQISAAHVKLGEGQVDQAFTFTFLDKAKIEVLKTARN